jgi:hydrogenase nickel incorporation protein HypA/HybF
MHESSFTESLLSLALSKAKEAGDGKITRINVVLGDLSGMDSSCVEQYFEILKQDTQASQAVLIFEKKPLSLKCRKCGKEFAPANVFWECPDCHEASVEIVSGRDCFLESIEVE